MDNNLAQKTLQDALENGSDDPRDRTFIASPTSGEVYSARQLLDWLEEVARAGAEGGSEAAARTNAAKILRQFAAAPANEPVEVITLQLTLAVGDALREYGQKLAELESQGQQQTDGPADSDGDDFPPLLH